MPAAAFLADAENDHMVGNATFTPNATLYLALCTVEPIFTDDGGSITEIAYTGYARAPVTASEMGSSAAGIMLNSATIEFPEMTGGTGTGITFLALLDGNAGTSGDGLYGWGALDSSPVEIASGETPRFTTNGLTFKRV